MPWGCWQKALNAYLILTLADLGTAADWTCRLVLHAAFVNIKRQKCAATELPPRS